MAFKYFVPKKKILIGWLLGQYFNRKNLIDCDTDGLLPIFSTIFKQVPKILEAGCGLGKWVIYFSKRDYDILVLDSYKVAIDVLRKI